MGFCFLPQDFEVPLPLHLLQGHGLLRSAYGGGACDDNILNADVRLDCISSDEGLYTLVQTGGCRRRVLTAVYKNKTACMFSVLI